MATDLRMNEYTCFLVMPQHVDTIWPKVAPWILQAMDLVDEANPVAIQRVKDDITRGACQLWGIMSEDQEILAVAVTGTGIIGGRSAVVVRYLCGREMEKWLHAIALIERWARNNDFEIVEVWGRPGWIKALAPHGYKHSYHVLEKSVSKEIH